MHSLCLNDTGQDKADLLIAHVSSSLGLLPVLRPLALVHVGLSSHLSPLTGTALSRSILGLGCRLVLVHTLPAPFAASSATVAVQGLHTEPRTVSCLGLYIPDLDLSAKSGHTC